MTAPGWLAPLLAWIGGRPEIGEPAAARAIVTEAAAGEPPAARDGVSDEAVEEVLRLLGMLRMSGIEDAEGLADFLDSAGDDLAFALARCYGPTAVDAGPRASPAAAQPPPDDEAEALRHWISATAARPGDGEGWDALAAAFVRARHRARRAGYRTFATLADAVDSLLAVRRESESGTPDGFVVALDSVSGLFDRIADGTAPRNRTYYDLIQVIDGLRAGMEEAASGEGTSSSWPGGRAGVATGHGRGAPADDDELRSEGPNELQEIFLEEMSQHLDALTAALLVLDRDPRDRPALFDIMRSAHSIKGSGAVASYQGIAALAHAMEDLLMLLRDEELPVPPSLVSLSLRGVDALVRLKDAAGAGANPVPDPALVATFNDFSGLVRGGIARFRDDPAGAEALCAAALPAPAVAVATDPAASTQPGSYVSVDLRQLDALMNLAADLVISRTRLTAGLEDTRANLAGLAEERRSLRAGGLRVKRTFELHRATEGAVAAVASNYGEEAALYQFGELDVQLRNLRDGIAGVDDLCDRLAGGLSDMDGSLAQLSMIADRMHELVTRARMIPVRNVFNRFPRAVRDIARGLGKEIRLETLGGETPLDRMIVAEIGDPLMHIVRNAADHGLESPERRLALGKPAVGTITLAARQSANQVLIEVSDDGRGIDFERVRAKALQKAFMTADEAAQATEPELLRVLLRPGFSTAETVTDLSGRGVGLDVVNESVRALKGTLSLSSKPGRGTTFTLRLPMSLSITQALLVSVGGERYALPLSAVEEIGSLALADIRMAGGRAVFDRRGELLPVLDLGAILGTPERDLPAGGHVIVLGDGMDRAGFFVDRLAGRQQLVAKDLGGGLMARVELARAGAVLADGSVVLVLDPAALLKAAWADADGHFEGKAGGAADTARSSPTPDDSGASGQAVAAPAAVPEPAAPPVPASPIQAALRPKVAVQPAGMVSVPPARPATAASVRTVAPRIHILVVDDSVSVRRHVAGMLTDSGFQVTMACDGLDALAKLDQTRVDMVVTDLEMPLMHGYELITEIRSSPRLRELPIVILSGRAGETHSRKGLELGANAYVEKPFDPTELIGVIRSVRGWPGASA